MRLQILVFDSNFANLTLAEFPHFTVLYGNILLPHYPICTFPLFVMKSILLVRKNELSKFNSYVFGLHSHSARTIKPRTRSVSSLHHSVRYYKVLSTSFNCSKIICVSMIAVNKVCNYEIGTRKNFISSRSL